MHQPYRISRVFRFKLRCIECCTVQRVYVRVVANQNVARAAVGGQENGECERDLECECPSGDAEGECGERGPLLESEAGGAADA